MPSRKWRSEARRRSTGVFWRLETGREDERARVNLGQVTKTQADAALGRIQALEDAGRAGRWIAWHASEPEMAIAALVADADLMAALDPRPDYAAMPLEQYVREVYAPWRAQDRPRTWKREAWVLDQALIDLGRHRLAEVDSHVVADYLDRLVCKAGARAGKPMAGNTKRLRRAAIQAVLHRAYRLKHITTKPDLAEFEIRDSTRPVRQKSDPLTLEEVGRLMDASKPRHRAMWAVGAGQGLRPSELARLDWSGVSWSDCTIAVPPDETGEGKTEESVAVVPMTPLTHTELRRWWGVCHHPREGLIFPARGGSKYGDGGFRRALSDAAERAEIGRHVNPYLLRDSFATIAWSLGIDMDTTRRMMRHTDETMLRRVYQRPRPRDLVERVAAFSVTEEEAEDEDGG